MQSILFQAVIFFFILHSAYAQCSETFSVAEKGILSGIIPNQANGFEVAFVLTPNPQNTNEGIFLGKMAPG
jgi:hypothetical protein